ncbi:hypothetical protein [Halomonas sp. C22]|uniref:hypothetical protein n=1 Tax=Halomonas sp. C22 TaxID=2580567 RepID=UPI0011A6CCC2|nr:hypothetical protein [Halomonas sp. C22]
MDKQTPQTTKRPRVLTLCMLAATVSTLALAGCGNGEDEMPPAQQPETMEQDATSGQVPSTTEGDSMMGEEPAAPADTMADDPMAADPGLDGDAASTQEPMPGETTDMTDPQEEPGFGEGTDPMPGANDEVPADDEDEMTTTQ